MTLLLLNSFSRKSPRSKSGRNVTLRSTSIGDSSSDGTRSAQLLLGLAFFCNINLRNTGVANALQLLYPRMYSSPTIPNQCNLHITSFSVNQAQCRRPLTSSSYQGTISSDVIRGNVWHRQRLVAQSIKAGTGWEDYLENSDSRDDPPRKRQGQSRGGGRDREGKRAPDDYSYFPAEHSTKDRSHVFSDEAHDLDYGDSPRGSARGQKSQRGGLRRAANGDFGRTPGMRRRGASSGGDYNSGSHGSEGRGLGRASQTTRLAGSRGRQRPKMEDGDAGLRYKTEYFELLEEESGLSGAWDNDDKRDEENETDGFKGAPSRRDYARDGESSEGRQRLVMQGSLRRAKAANTRQRDGMYKVKEQHDWWESENDTTERFGRSPRQGGQQGRGERDTTGRNTPKVRSGAELRIKRREDREMNERERRASFFSSLENDVETASGDSIFGSYFSKDDGSSKKGDKGVEGRGRDRSGDRLSGQGRRQRGDSGGRARDGISFGEDFDEEVESARRRGGEYAKRTRESTAWMDKGYSSGDGLTEVGDRVGKGKGRRSSPAWKARSLSHSGVPKLDGRGGRVVISKPAISFLQRISASVSF